MSSDSLRRALAALGDVDAALEATPSDAATAADHVTRALEVLAQAESELRAAADAGLARRDDYVSVTAGSAATAAAASLRIAREALETAIGTLREGSTDSGAVALVPLRIAHGRLIAALEPAAEAAGAGGSV